MLTEEEKQASAIERIRILREAYGDENPEVKAWDAAHPKVAEPVPTAEAETLAPKGKIGGLKALGGGIDPTLDPKQ